MQNFLATYDIKETYPDPHAKFIENAVELGWSTFIWGAQSKKWYALPNTTLHGEFTDRDAAVAALRGAQAATKSQLGACILEKWIITPSTGCTFDSDKKYDPA